MIYIDEVNLSMISVNGLPLSANAGPTSPISFNICACASEPWMSHSASCRSNWWRRCIVWRVRKRAQETSGPGFLCRAYDSDGVIRRGIFQKAAEVVRLLSCSGRRRRWSEVNAACCHAAVARASKGARHPWSRLAMLSVSWISVAAARQSGHKPKMRAWVDVVRRSRGWGATRASLGLDNADNALEPFELFGFDDAVWATAMSTVAAQNAAAAAPAHFDHLFERLWGINPVVVGKR